MNIHLKFYLIFLLSVLVSCGHSGYIRMGAIFSDNMVLQQSSSVLVWGWTEPGVAVSLNCDWQERTYSSRADRDGRFEIEIETIEAGGPYNITLSSKNELKIRNVMLGEVWLASGQSNMEIPMIGYGGRDTIFGAASAIRNSENNNIRLFHVERNLAFDPSTVTSGEWKVANPSSVAWYSAVAYHFAEELYDSLKVPIGIISCSYGGSPIESWLPNEVIESDSLYKSLSEQKEATKKASLKSKAEVQSEFSNWLLSSRQNSQLEKEQYILHIPKDMKSHDIRDYEGELLFKKEFTIDKTILSDSLVLSLGEIDDIGQVYLNDTLLWEEVLPSKSYRHCRAQFHRRLLNDGVNVLKVYVANILWSGGLKGPKEEMYIKRVSDGQIIHDLDGEWVVSKSFKATGVEEMPNEGVAHFQMATSLYNGMLSQLIPFKIKGVIWYQGEANVWHADTYVKSFKDLISSWRSAWTYTMPFYYVQLAPYNYNSGENQQSALLREAQFFSRGLEAVNMAVALDLGVNNNIHPPYKKEVSHRLALHAFRDLYGYDCVSSGPMYSHFVIEGDVVRLYFEEASSNLQIQLSDVSGFEICGEDGLYYPATVKVCGKELEISSQKVEHPTQVRYAWSDTATATLFNAVGLPASSFRTIEK